MSVVCNLFPLSSAKVSPSPELETRHVETRHVVETRHALSLRPFLIILFFNPFYISNHQLDRGVTVEIIFL